MVAVILGEIPRAKGSALRVTQTASGVEIRHWSPICAAAPHLSPTRDGLTLTQAEAALIAALLTAVAGGAA
jgi:hypothetical protein